VDVKIYPEPNPAVTAILRSAWMRSLVFEKGELAEALYREEVAKRIGRLALSTHVSTEIGGARNDRWVAHLDVGGAGPLGTPEYALAHEFGRGEHPGSEFHSGLGEEHIVQHGAHDLNRVLEIMSVASYL
jgi:hypothetical protein